METVQSIERALDILEVFSYSSPELGLVEISKKVGLSKGTTYRIVYTLMKRGYISQENQSGKYRLGPKTFEIGSVVMSQMEIRKVAHPYLEELRDITGETVHLVIQDKGEVLYLDKVDSTRAIRMNSFIGQRLPMHCTAVGKVLLAELPEIEVNYICNMKGMTRSTSKTITNLDMLKRHLKIVKEQGYALDDEENEEGLRCIAAPIRDCNGKVIAAISISAPVMRLNNDRIPEMVKAVQTTAERISYQMGYRKTGL
ncbi:IclR family transcriptional regulator [Neomoorella humiferrea]|uniref:IclR family transcriptional regulator n=1 Tax=Neomoorella humiferrea TaxID=676965 RepID=UPI003D8BE111